MKRKPNNRRKRQRSATIRDLNQNVLDNLARIAEGKTPPERVQAQTDYFFSCESAAQLVMIDIFKKEDKKEIKELEQFFAEKNNEKGR